MKVRCPKCKALPKYQEAIDTRIMELVPQVADVPCQYAPTYYKESERRKFRCWSETKNRSQWCLYCAAKEIVEMLG